MAKRYEVTHVPHFIDGRMIYPGQGEASIVELPKGVSPGRWLVEVSKKGRAAKESDDQSDFSVKHKGGGRWGVVDADGEWVGDFIGTEDEAKAESERLQEGGEPFVEEPEQGE